MKKIFIIILILFFSSETLLAEEAKDGALPKHEWSFKGVTGTFDRSALQRGYKVYREVCSGCHSMKLLYYRDLVDIGFTQEQIKVIASDYTVLDGPNKIIIDNTGSAQGVVPYLPLNELQKRTTE